MFAVESLADGVRIRFSANLALLDRAVTVVVELLRQWRAEGTLFDVKLLLREALLNAVLHGNRSDSTLTVELEVRLLPGAIALRVADEGPGFAWRERLHRPPDMESTSGRGLTIMTLYADEVYFNACGNEVRLVKRISGLRDPAVADGPADATDFSRRTS